MADTGIATLTNTVSFLEKTKLYIDINKLSTTPSATTTATATSIGVSTSSATGGGVTVERSSTPPVVGGSEYMAVG